MREGDVLILKGREVDELLAGREREIIRAVEAAYVAHGAGRSSLPHSTFLRFPDSPADRVIALPAYLGDGFEAAGVKWIASFPGNVERGMERASAVMIMNSTRTGRPEAILEASVISAKRTAAGAALAAARLLGGRAVATAGMIGCGLINFETARFLRAALPGLASLVVFDRSRAQAERFAEVCGDAFEGLRVEVAATAEGALAAGPLVALATTAAEPHIDDLSMCEPGAAILHTSLRDLAPGLILGCDNVVDDVDHVCRAQTSVHLAEQLSGGRDFIRCTLADILRGAAPARADAGRTIFSPFGLGVLDLAVARLVCEAGLAEGRGLVVDSFLPEHWAGKQRLSAARGL